MDHGIRREQGYGPAWIVVWNRIDEDDFDEPKEYAPHSLTKREPHFYTLQEKEGARTVKPVPEQQ